MDNSFSTRFAKPQTESSSERMGIVIDVSLETYNLLSDYAYKEYRSVENAATFIFTRAVHDIEGVSPCYDNW